MLTFFQCLQFFNTLFSCNLHKFIRHFFCEEKCFAFINFLKIIMQVFQKCLRCKRIQLIYPFFTKVLGKLYIIFYVVLLNNICICQAKIIMYTLYISRNCRIPFVLSIHYLTEYQILNQMQIISLVQIVFLHFLLK